MLHLEDVTKIDEERLDLHCRHKGEIGEENVKFYDKVPDMFSDFESKGDRHMGRVSNGMNPITFLRLMQSQFISNHSGNTETDEKLRPER